MGKIKEKSLIVIDEIGDLHVCSTIARLAAYLGVSSQYISKRIKEGKPVRDLTVKGFMDCIYIVESRDGRFMVCRRYKDLWVTIGSEEIVTHDKDVLSYWDISESYYGNRWNIQD